MKKILAYIFAIVMIVTLSGCGAEVTINGGKNSSPTQEMVSTDLEKALSEKAPTVQLTGFETIKSLTEENSYQITLQVTAQNTYADWQYQVDLFYVKYDQGWMIERSAWTSETYKVARLPDENTMVEYATEYLLNHEVYSDASYADYMVPMFDVSMQYGNNVAVDKEVLELCWTAIEEGKYSSKKWQFATLWEYVPMRDCWELTLDPNAGKHDYPYYLHKEYLMKEVHNLDYSGERELLSFTDKKLSTLTIADFSKGSLDACIPGYIDSFDWFVGVADPESVMTGYDMVYANEDGDLITFIVHDTVAYVYYYSKDGKVAACAEIREDLPELS